MPKQPLGDPELGRKIRALRERLALDQAQLARQLGFDRVSITVWESAKRAAGPIPQERLRVLAALQKPRIEFDEL